MDQKHKSNLIITCLCLIIVFVSLLTMYDNFSFHTYNTKTYYDYFLSLNHQGFTLQDYELYKDQSNYHCGDGTLVLGKIDSLVDGQDIDVIIQINRKQHIDYSLKYLEGGSYSLENKEDLKNIKEIKNTLEFFGVDKEDEGNQKRLRDLENGQCLFQDLYGRVGVIQIHPVFADLFHAFDTRPPVQTEEMR